MGMYSWQKDRLRRVKNIVLDDPNICFRLGSVMFRYSKRNTKDSIYTSSPGWTNSFNIEQTRESKLCTNRSLIFMIKMYIHGFVDLDPYTLFSLYRRETANIMFLHTSSWRQERILHQRNEELKNQYIKIDFSNYGNVTWKRKYIEKYFKLYDSDLCPVDVPDESRSYVYFIEAVGSKHIKIGTTKNIKKRISALSTASPHQLRLCWFEHGDERLESALHTYFDKYRRNGEWFEYNYLIKSYIASGGISTLPFWHPLRHYGFFGVKS